ncbi:MAG: cytidine deaminase [Butyrivibrio sp.]|jgi:cytidine deaminase|nr:cytidine deaminase [Butyrivibrio sp.]
MKLSEEKIQELIREASKMLMRSYIPYSHFAVGAALLCEDGRIYTGCNIENAAFTPSNCAERTAFFKAVSEGEMKFTAIAIIGGKNRKVTDFCAPCGVCRQVMMEFCNPQTFQVITAKSQDEYRIDTLAQVLPDGFGPGNLS